MNKLRRYTLIAALAIFGILTAIYTINPNRWRTQQMLESKGKPCSMLMVEKATTAAAIGEQVMPI